MAQSVLDWDITACGSLEINLWDEDKLLLSDTITAPEMIEAFAYDADYGHDLDVWQKFIDQFEPLIQTLKHGLQQVHGGR